MSVYEFGPFKLDAERLLLFDRGEPVSLGPKVSSKRCLRLVEHPGDVLTEELAARPDLARRLRRRSESRTKRLRTAQVAARALERRCDRNNSTARLSLYASGAPFG